MLSFYHRMAFSPERLEQYKERERLHFRHHLISMYNGSIPVFVGAIVSSAVLAVINAFSTRNDINFISAILYAVFIIYPFCVYQMYTMPENSKLGEFSIRVLTEVASFTFNDAFTLMFANEILPGYNQPSSFGFWIGLLVLVISSLAVANFIQNNVLWFEYNGNVDEHHFYRQQVRMFESEVFALALAYTFTLLLVSGVCGNSYATFMYTDDDVQIQDTKNLCSTSYFTIVYPMGLTYLVGLLQVYIFDPLSNAECSMESAYVDNLVTDESIDNPILEGDGNDDKKSVQLSNRSLGSRSEVPDISEPVNLEDIEDGQNSNNNQDTNKDQDVDDDYQEAVESQDESGRSYHINYYIASFFLLANVTSSYIVSCAWYVWVVIVIQAQLGDTVDADYHCTLMLLLALIMTYAAVWYMSLETLRYDQLTGNSHTRQMTKTRWQRVQLRVRSARLTVGWLWEGVVISASATALSGLNNKYPVVIVRWLDALVKILLAVVTIALAFYVQSKRSIKDAQYTGHELRMAEVLGLPAATWKRRKTTVGKLRKKVMAKLKTTFAVK